ncbi:MAG: hypothetical protein ACI9RP_001520 [Cyclobacteriaceae bacterium]|jgi:hypothetical protein
MVLSPAVCFQPFNDAFEILPELFIVFRIDITEYYITYTWVRIETHVRLDTGITAIMPNIS